MCYNFKTKIPVWVKYEFTAKETDGPYTRKGMFFRQDEKIIVPQADDSDYRRSGWSRGHLAPAGDFKWSEDAMWETFYYTNCCPQNEKLNSGLWNSLEMRVRRWANEYSKVEIVTGPIIGENRYGTIGANKVVVPDKFFKALLIHNGTCYHAIAFVVLNSEQNAPLKNCAITVNELEKLINTDLFSFLDNQIEESVEGSLNYKIWRL